METTMNRDAVGGAATDDFTQESDAVSKRRAIRSNYRLIENRINEGKDEIASLGSDKFIALIREVEEMHQHVENPREQVVDAEALRELASILMTSVRAQTSGGVTPAEFVSCLIDKFGGQKRIKGLSPTISWQKIGSVVSPIFKNGPGCITMIGPMKNEIKPWKRVVRARRSRSTVKARPKELEKAVEVVSETDTNMHLMFEILKKARRVKVENLILNRNSFAQTVENLFVLSFLVKDGRVRIDIDEAGSQVAFPTNGPSAEEIKSGAVKTHQFMFRFDFDDWKLMTTLVAEGEELMPPRTTFANATSTKAQSGQGDEDSTRAGDPHLIPTAVVKKFLRNSGHSMQNSYLTDIDDNYCTFGNWDLKRKRSIS